MQKLIQPFHRGTISFSLKSQRLQHRVRECTLLQCFDFIGRFTGATGEQGHDSLRHFFSDSYPCTPSLVATGIQQQHNIISPTPPQTLGQVADGNGASLYIAGVTV